MYYESKIQSSAITKPDKGFVVAYNTLPQLYDQLLPKLGLTAKEIADFTAYWGKTLPKANYYFVGIMPRSEIDKNEPMTVSPQPNTINRVRLYFQPLDQKITVQAPNIQPMQPSTKEFSIDEWGAFVQTDNEHVFTCSQ